MCVYLHKHLNVARNSNGYRLVLQDGSAVWAPEAVWTLPRLQQQELPALDGGLPPVDCLMAWQVAGAETGIDRVWLQQLGLDRYALNGAQIKVGKDTRSGQFTPGVLSTQRGKPRCKDMDAGTTAGVLAKAERGLLALVPALRQAFPMLRHAVIELGSLHILSNKESLARAAEAFPAAAAEHGVHKASLQLLGTVQEVAGAGAEWPWEVHSGMGWMEDCMPSDVFARM